MAPYHGRLLGGMSRYTRIDVVQCTSALPAFGDLDLGGTHEFTVDQLDILSRQLFDAIDKLKD